MIQAGFDFERAERAERADEKAQHLPRVSRALGPRIVAWALEHVGQTFRASDLHEAVGGAPSSADRVLRDLRRRGVVVYELLDRASSLYEVRAVRPDLLDATAPPQRPERLRRRRAKLLEQLAEVEAALADEGEAA